MENSILQELVQMNGHLANIVTELHELRKGLGEDSTATNYALKNDMLDSILRQNTKPVAKQPATESATTTAQPTEVAQPEANQTWPPKEEPEKRKPLKSIFDV